MRKSRVEQNQYYGNKKKHFNRSMKPGACSLKELTKLETPYPVDQKEKVKDLNKLNE